MSASRLAGEDIICLALRAWESPWKNNQQVMSHLAQSNRVLYVGPARSLRDAIVGRGPGRTDRPAHGPSQEAHGLVVYHEPWFLSRIRHTRRGASAINWVTGQTRMSHVRAVARRLGFSTPVLWVYDPMSAVFLGTFNEKLVVFHVIDNYDEYYPAGEPHLRALMATRQRVMLERADVVFAVSEPLHRRCRAVNANSHLVPNGVDYELFQTVLRTGRTPDDVAGIPRPIIGYVGALQPRMDFRLLEELASRRPDWSFLLVGPAEYLDGDDRLQMLCRRPNVYCLGPKPVQQVPLYMKACDVGIIPYRQDGFSPYSDSLKLYEYLACGCPVVSSDMLSSRRFAPLVRIAGDVDGFIYAIQGSLAEDGALRMERIAVTEQHSWDRRVSVMRELVGMALAGSQRATVPQ